MTSEREPLRLMKFKMVLTWSLVRPSSSRLALVCSLVTFSAWSIMLLISEVWSWRSRNSRRPERILRLLMRARIGVFSSKAWKVARRVVMISTS